MLADMMIAMWNYMGWDQRVDDALEVGGVPQRTYPKAMIAAVILVFR